MLQGKLEETPVVISAETKRKLSVIADDLFVAAAFAVLWFFSFVVVSDLLALTFLPTPWDIAKTVICCWVNSPVAFLVFQAIRRQVRR